MDSGSTDRQLADVNKLVDTTYTTKSGRTCRFELIGRGGLRCVFKGGPPSQEDSNEVDYYVASTLKAYIHGGQHTGNIRDPKAIQKEIDQYQDFLKGKTKPIL